MSDRTLAPFGRRAAPVVDNVAVGAYRVISVADLEGPTDPQPGQFYMLATRAGWGAGTDERPFLPRAFSFSRRVVDPGAQGVRLEFLLEAVGPGTERLGRARPGEELWIVGPLGVGFSARLDAGERPLLVGGGIGVAPVLALSDDLGPAATVLLGFRSAEHAAAAALFAAGDAPTVATDDGSVGRAALVTELVGEQLDGGVPRPTVYACGPPPMLEAVRMLCEQRSVPAQLALESGMACGFGACFGCVVPTRSGYVRLCLDGPVLAAAELDSALTPGAGH